MPRYIWLTLWALSVMMIVMVNLAVYRHSVDTLYGEVKKCLSDVDHSLNGALHFAKRKSLAMAPALQASKGNLKTILDVVLGQIYEGKGLVRFAWLNADDVLRVSSLTGMVGKAVDLSDREYVKQARLLPMQPIISKIVLHAIRKKPVLVVATGIVNSNGKHLGTLNAVMSVNSLIVSIHNSMKFCPSLYRVTTPHDEVVTANVDDTQLLHKDDVVEYGKAGEQFVVSGLTAPNEIHALQAIAVARTAVMTVAISVIMGVMYWLIHVRFIRPMQVALHSIDAMVNSRSVAPLSRLNHRLEAMGRLVELFETMQAQMDESRKQLNLAKQHIALTKQQQAEFFQATSAELARAYDTIAAYGDYLEDQILLQSLKPDVRYDFDDVTEMGVALRQLSDDYVRLCHITPPREQNHQASLADARRASVSVSQSVANMIIAYAVMIERRNLHVISTLDDTALITQDAWSVAAMQALLLLLIQHARDEARIEISTNETGALVIFLSEFRQSMLPVTVQDFGEFIPSMQRHIKGEIEAYLNRHAFVMIAQSYLAIAASSLRVEVDERGGVRMVVMRDV